MKNLLKNKQKKFNSKKGFTLLELIVAIMILMIVISASVQGLNISYRSAMLGAAKNDAQSLAERNCDIIMSAIVTNVEKKTFTTGTLDTLDGMFVSGSTEFSAATMVDIVDDLGINLTTGGYNAAQYATIQQVAGNATAVKNKRGTETNDNLKYQYFTIERSDVTLNGKTYQKYRITTYVYYTTNSYITCEGEVSVLPQT